MFVAKLWRGEYSLVRTYWLFNVLLGAILGAPISVIGNISPEALASIFIPSLIYFVFYGVYVFVASVGLWRSASKYENSVIWKFLSKAYSVISIATIVISVGFLAQNLLFKNFSLGSASYKVYACQNPKAQNEAECNYAYIGVAKYSVNKDKSEVFGTFSIASSNQQNIIKLDNCVVIDNLNWQCGLPDEVKVDSSGTGVVVRHHIFRSNNGVISISDAYLIGMNSGKPTSTSIIKAIKVEKN